MTPAKNAGAGNSGDLHHTGAGNSGDLHHTGAGSSGDLHHTGAGSSGDVHHTGAGSSGEVHHTGRGSSGDLHHTATKKVSAASSSVLGKTPEASSPCVPGASSSGSLDWSTLEIRQGDRFPHWTCDNAMYHVSFRLADSVPWSQRNEWLREREHILTTAESMGRELSDHEEKRLQYLYSEKIESSLDAGHGQCWLARPDIAAMVEGALHHFDGERYRLHAWCIMPNHVHVIVEPLPEQDLGKIVHSWKSFTANKANGSLNRTGQFWQHESYDRIIRSEKEYYFQVQYVWENPDKAGVTALRWKRPKRLDDPELEAPATFARRTR